jgi:hypothetical protein
MFDFHECELEIQKYKKYQNGYPVCHGRLHKKLIRVLLRFRLGLGVRDSVGGAVVVVRHRLFNRHLNVPWTQTGFIHLQTLFQLQIGVSVHETLDKLLTEPVSPV